MPYRIAFFLLLTALAMSALTCLGQAETDACDFSAYRPLVFDHALYNVAIEKVEPKYPAAGKALRVSGEVNVKILVNREGRVVRACAVSGHPILRATSEAAARKWLFKTNFGLSSRLRKKYIQSFIVFVFRPRA